MAVYEINSVIQKVWPDWTVVGIIGSGAYGEVYRAERANGLVYSHSAIKVISIPRNKNEIDSLSSSSQIIIDQAKKDYEDVANGFADEIKLMESLKGTSNIVNIEDFKILLNEDGLSWTILIRMELLDPIQLDAKYSEEEILELGIDICSALETCAKVGVIHRDIKPSNILINSFGSFKLGDFGIAKAMNQTSFRMTTGKGTPNFMAPEVAQNGNYGIHGVRVDIYSLGQVLYYYLNRCRGPFIPLGKQLLSYKDRAEAYSRRMSGETLPAPIDASKEMAHLVLKACAFKPEDRFANATEMKAALNAVKSGTYILPKEKKKLSFKSSVAPVSTAAKPQPSEQVISAEVIDLDKTLTTAQPINDKKPKASKMRSKEIVKNRRDKKTQDSVKVENANIETELTETVLAIDPDKTTAVKRHNDIKSQEAESKSESKGWRIVVALLAILVLVFGSIAVYNILDYTKTVEAIRIINKPVKSTYEWGETLDTTGLELAIDYSFGKDGNIASGFECSPNRLTESGVQRITITYQGESVSFVVTVKEPTVTSISVSSVPTKTNYNVGDTLNVYGLIIEAKYSDRSKEIIESDFVSRGVSFTPTKLSTAGTQAVTVTYGGKTTSFNVTVKEITVSSISLSSNPTKTTYDVGDTLDTSGLKINAKYSDGTTKTISSGFTCSPTKLSTAGTQKITVAYNGKYTSFDVEVKLSTVSQGACGRNLTWKLTSDGTLTISGTGRMLDYVNDGAPWSSYKDSVKCVVINEGVTSIGNYAFYPLKRPRIEMIPDSIEVIGHTAFWGCDLPDNVVLSNNVKTIGDAAFTYSDIESITIPASVTSIEHGAFDRCLYLTSIVVLSDDNFYKSNDGVLFNKSGTELVAYPAGKRDTSYTIAHNVEKISYRAFSGCKLKSIIIPKSVTNIGAFAFYGWDSDQTIYIEGRTSAPLGWNELWAEYCDAKIVWNP